MKKIIFVVLIVFALSAVYDTPFAAENSEYTKALKYYNSKKYKEAVEVLKEHVQKAPSAVDYYLMGYALYKLGKFEEANEAFKEAYLLDPEFSLEKAGLIKKTPEAKPEEAEKPAAEKAPDAEKQPEVKKEPVPSKEAKPQKPEDIKTAKEKPVGVTADKKPAVAEPKKTEPQKVAPIEAKKVEPQKQVPATTTAPAAPVMPPVPKTFPQSPQQLQKVMPEMPAPLMKMMAWIMPILIIIQIILMIFAIYSAVCHFLIAKKLNVTAPWTAFLPLTILLLSGLELIVGPEFFASNNLLSLILALVVAITSYVGYHWPVIGSARKSWWWIFLPIPLFIVVGILMVIPFIGIFGLLLFAGFYGYLYICITENLGKNKWLGLLMLVPVANLVWLGILAFSKGAEKTGMMEEMPQEESTPEQ